MTTHEDDLPPTTPFTLELEGDVLNPPYVGSIEANAVSRDERLTDGCGNAETRQTSTGMYQLDVSGILLEPDRRLLVEMDVRNRECQITQPLVNQTSFIIKKVNLTKPEDLNTGEFPSRSVTEATRREATSEQALTHSQAYRFTLQTKEPKSENQTG